MLSCGLYILYSISGSVQLHIYCFSFVQFASSANAVFENLTPSSLSVKCRNCERGDAWFNLGWTIDLFISQFPTPHPTPIPNQ